MTWGGDIDDKVDAIVGGLGGLARPVGKRGATDLTRVPRPVAPAKPGKIDLSKAPSSMELAAKRWSER